MKPYFHFTWVIYSCHLSASDLNMTCSVTFLIDNSFFLPSLWNCARFHRWHLCSFARMTFLVTYFSTAYIQSYKLSFWKYRCDFFFQICFCPDIFCRSCFSRKKMFVSRLLLFIIVCWLNFLSSLINFFFNKQLSC